MKKFILLLLMLLQAYSGIFAQLPGSVTGTWKRTGMSTVDVTGTATDLQASMMKAMPCSKNITYTFKADGSILTNVPDECSALKKTLESMNGDGKCTLTGNKLIVTSSKIPTATYEISFKGNTMTWFFDYAANPKTLNPGGQSKSLTIVYTKI